MSEPADPQLRTPVPPPTGLFTGAVRVFDLSLGQMLWSRRTIFMALIVGLPVLLALVIRLLIEFGVPVTRMGRDTVTGSVLFGLMVWGFFIRFAVPVLGIFYGTALVADEVEDKTITYLFTRPVRREAVFLGKYLAYLACTIGVVLPAVMLVWLLIAPVGGHLGAGFPDLVKDLAILAAGLVAYGALFGLVGATLKRPLVVGLLFAFGWEPLVMSLPGYLKRLSISYYLQGLVPHAMPGDSPMAVMQTLFRDVPGLAESAAGLAVVTLLALWASGRAVARREYVLEQ
jgi:ABC-type transport system involved in multi-copper enzyme maturation permease subunit